MAVLLRRMAETGVIEFKPDGRPITGVGRDSGAGGTLFDRFGPVVRFSTTTKSRPVQDLQRMLSTFPGIFVKVDGVPE